MDDVRTLRDDQLTFIGFVQLSFVQHLLHEILGELSLRVLLLHSQKLLFEGCNTITLLRSLLRVLTIHLIFKLLLIVLLFHFGLRASPFATALHEVSTITLACYN